MKPFDENGAFRPAADGDGLRRLAERCSEILAGERGRPVQ